MAKYCSDLTLLHIDNQHLFLQHYDIFALECGVKMDQPDHLPYQICIESHSNRSLYLVFLKVCLWHTEPFRKRLDALFMLFLFPGNNRQHMSVCAKIISSWVSKVLRLLRHVCSRYSLWCHCIWSLAGGVHAAGR